jgi:hypothetical protein
MNEVHRRSWIPLMTCAENKRPKRRHMAIPAASVGSYPYIDEIPEVGAWQPFIMAAEAY